MPKIFAISGSLRSVSINSTLLQQFAELAAPKCDVDFYDRLAELPHFNPDIEDCGDEAVADLITRVRDADVFVVATPEYAHGIPGALKNSLDWLVGSDAFIEKPYSILSVCPRSLHARAALIEVLDTMSGMHLSAGDVRLDLTRDPSAAKWLVTLPESTTKIMAAISFLASRNY